MYFCRIVYVYVSAATDDFSPLTPLRPPQMFPALLLMIFPSSLCQICSGAASALIVAAIRSASPPLPQRLMTAAIRCLDYDPGTRPTAQDVLWIGLSCGNLIY